MAKKTTKTSWLRKPVGAPAAAVANAYLKKIRKKRGGLSPQIIVIESQGKRSPLHNCFEWDDTKAAKRYRINQAGYILRMLVIEFEPYESVEPITVRALISPKELEKSSNTSYVPINEVLADVDLSDAYDRQLLKRLISIKQIIKNVGSAKTQKRFAKVVAAIDAVKI